MSDLNLYPQEPAGVRRRRRRAPRPAHLPPFDDTRLTAPSPPPKAATIAPAAATFGAAVGANNALLFHRLKADPVRAAPPADTLDVEPP